MELGKASHLLRATLIAGIGALVTVLLSVLIGWLLYQPRKLPSTLARKVDGARTVFFLRTTDASAVRDAFRTWMGKEPIIDAESAALQSYELAILRNATGSALSWNMETRSLTDQSAAAVQSSEGTDIPTDSSATTPNDRIVSLASASFFRLHAPPLSDSGAHLAYVQLRDVSPILQLSKKPVTRTLLHSFSDVMLTWTTERQTKETRGMLWLKPLSPLQFTTSALLDERDRQEEGSGTVLMLQTNDPGQLLEAFQRNLTEEDSAFAEGFTGILQAKLRQFTGRTDIEQVRSDLLSEPIYLSIGTPETGPRPFLLSGRARNPAVLEEWTERIMATATPGIVRMFPLSHGNRRIDVTTGETAVAEQRPDGWIIRTIDGDASPALIIASRENAYVVSNDLYRLEAFLTTGLKMMATKAESGLVDIGAFRTLLQDAMPILSDILPSPLFEQDGELRWSMKTTPGSVAVGWSWKGTLE
ncbi:MAG: hypothetical protein PHZ00_01360 [Candidatus Peribacteraceae bacterium]|nr:hypothetical protein [Candidatus Peribacteraceae bacterium]